MKKKNKRDGYIILAQVEDLYRILYSRKNTPEKRIATLNAYARDGQHKIIHLIPSQEVVADHLRMTALFGHRKFTDAAHADLWFDLSDEDVTFIKALGGVS